MEKETTFELSKAEGPLSLSGKMEIFFDLHRKSRTDKAEFMTPEMESYFRGDRCPISGEGMVKFDFLEDRRQGGRYIFFFRICRYGIRLQLWV